jgi:large conductance mechanosensitive channel
MWNEFKAFLLKSNAFALAVGVIIGAATGKVVSGIVDNLLMPVISLVIPSGSWREAQLVLTQTTGPDGKPVVNAIKYGALMGTIIDFVIVSFVVFLITKAVMRPQPEPTPTTKMCPECKETVALEARRCKWCSAQLAA